MNFKTTFVLGLISALPMFSRPLQAQKPPAPKAQPPRAPAGATRAKGGAPSRAKIAAPASADAIIAQATKMVEAGQLAPALKLLQEQLKSVRTPKERETLLIGTADLHFYWADVLSKQGRFEAAIEHLTAAYEVDKTRRPRDAAVNLSGIGDALFSLGRSEEALKYFQRALPIMRAEKDRAGEAATLTNIASVHISLRRYEESIRFNEQALPILRELKNRAVEAGALTQIGQALSDLSRHEEAIQLQEQALPILRELKNVAGEATVLIHIANSHESLSRRAQALAFYQQSLDLFRRAGDRARESITLSNIGATLSRLNRYQDALKYLEQALEIGRKEKSRTLQATALANMSATLSVLGRYEEMLQRGSQSLELARAEKNKTIEAMALNNLGGAYLHLGRYDEAHKYLQQALALHREIGDKQGEAWDSELLGHTNLELDRYPEALASLTRALLLHTERGDKWSEGKTLNGMGHALTLLGRFEEALACYGKSLPLARAIKDRRSEAEALNNTGLVLTLQNRHAEALAFYQQSLPLLHEIQDKKSEFLALSNLMLGWQFQKQPRLAIFYGKQSVNLHQEIRGSIQNLDAQTQRAFLQSHASTYRVLADLLIGEGRLSEAQQVLGMLKEEELFQFVRRDQAQAAGARQATLNAQEAAWEKRYEEITARVTQIGAEYGTLFGLATRDAAQEARMALLKLDLDVAEASFERFLAQLQAEFEAREQASAQVSNLPETRGLQETLREIGGDVAILSTIVGPDDFHVILMTADTIQAFKNPAPVPAPELRRKVLAFREAIENPHRDPLPAARELYSVVFCGGKVRQALEGANIKTLMWSLDDVLRYAPMSALHDGDKYLVESYAPSVFTLASHSRLSREPQKRWKALGLGVSKARANFSALPGVVAEMQAIIQPADAAAGSPEGEGADTTDGGVLPGTVALDEAFTLAALESGLRAKPQMVHIASHFQFKPGDETDSFLLLGEGQLPLDQLKKLRFSGVDLLTLSACDTASGGKDADGREVESFAELAQRQGAGAVMATLWPVADKSTPRLMSLFYRERQAADGLSKAEALRRAQLALLRGADGVQAQVLAGTGERGSRSDEKPEGGAASGAADAKVPFAHPFFWAPFVLIGNWR